MECSQINRSFRGGSWCLSILTTCARVPFALDSMHQVFKLRHTHPHAHPHSPTPAKCRYVGTIGCVEPSYVIQRFLDVQRIHNLTDYLEQLHSRVGACVSAAWVSGVSGEVRTRCNVGPRRQGLSDGYPAASALSYRAWEQGEAMWVA